MSQSLGTILSTRVSITSIEDNLERGQIFVFSTGAGLGPLCFCWNPPGAGTAIIEAWGAGGSGAQMCCCGHGLPGNSGAYVRRTITVNSTACFVCGISDLACGNASALCFRGCSGAACLCWAGSGTTGCMCAQGGTGGYSYCSTSTAPWCCFYGGGFCGTCLGPGCGIICNAGSSVTVAQAFGGTVNCPGCWSCVNFANCNNGAIWNCGFHPTIATPPGMSAACGQAINHGLDIGSVWANPSGAGTPPLMSAATSSSRYGSNLMGGLFGCWSGIVSCGCYEMNGCIAYAPPGSPGAAAYPCASVRDHAGRGGAAIVKITFY